MTKLTIETTDLLTLTEAAKLLGISRPTFYLLIDSAPLHPVFIGHNRYFLRTEIEYQKYIKTGRW